MKDGLATKSLEAERFGDSAAASLSSTMSLALTKVTISASCSGPETEVASLGSSGVVLVAPDAAETRDPPPSSNVEEEGTAQESQEGGEGYPDKDYDEDAVDLYRLIESKRFKNVSSSVSKEEANTWVIRRDPESGETRWRMSPLHAAVVFGAPARLVAALIEAAPSSLRGRDDRGMVPLHLAFRYSSGDAVLRLLLEGYPGGIHVRDNEEKIPVQRNALFGWERGLLEVYAAAATTVEAGRVKSEERERHEKILQERLAEVRSVQEIQLRKIEDSMKVQKAESDVARKECVDLLGHNQSLLLAGERLQAKIELLQKQSREDRAFIKELNKKFSSAEAEITAQRAEVAARDMQVEKLQNSARQKIEVCEQTSTTLRKTVQDMCKAHKAVEADCDLWKAKAEELSAYKPKCAELGRQVDILEDSNAQLEERNTQVTKERQECRSKVESLLENNEALQGSVAELTRILNEKTLEGEGWKGSYEKTKALLEKSDGELKRSTEEAESLKEEKGTLERDLGETKKSLASSRSEGADLRFELASVQKDLEAKTREHEAAAGEVARINEEKDIECTFQERLIMRLEVELRKEREANADLNGEVVGFLSKVSDQMDEAVRVVQKEKEKELQVVEDKGEDHQDGKEEEEKTKDEGMAEEKPEEATSAAVDMSDETQKEGEDGGDKLKEGEMTSNVMEEDAEMKTEERQDEKDDAPTSEKHEKQSSPPALLQTTPAVENLLTSKTTKTEKIVECDNAGMGRLEKKVNETLEVLTGAHGAVSIQRDELRSRVSGLETELADIRRRAEEEQRERLALSEKGGVGWFVCGAGL